MRPTTSRPTSRAWSSADAIGAATTLPGGVSGPRGCGRVGAFRLAARSASPRSSSSARVGDVTQVGEEVALLFLHVMTDVLDHHRDLRVEALVARVEVLELPEQPLHHVVLLERLEHHVVRVLDVLARPRVEHLLLDRRVLRELGDHLVDELALLLRRAVTRPLEPLEQLVDLAVVGFSTAIASGLRGAAPPARSSRAGGHSSSGLRRGRHAPLSTRARRVAHTRSRRMRHTRFDRERRG